MTPFRIVEVAIAILTLIGIVFGAFFYLQDTHASKLEVLQVQSQALDMDIKKDAEARAYYKDKESQGTLDDADKRRLEYLEEQLNLKYSKQRIYQEALIKDK